ncbi:MAG: pyridoxamine 5'-phosphate oxidase family protein [Gillisia sp.]
MSTKNLTSKEALEKMTSLVNAIKTAMLLTDLKKQPISAIPMTTKEVDEEGNIWFLSGLKSGHNSNIIQNPQVQLLYSNPSGMEFISIYGMATVITDKEKLNNLYTNLDDAWFEGNDDPNLSALKITPKEAYYWDTKQNKYISLFKMGLAAITGDKADVGKKGKLNL